MENNLLSYGLVLLIVVAVYGSSVELQSEFGLRSGQHAANNTPLCRTVRNIKKNLLQEFQSRFKNAELACDIQDNCKSTNCTYNYTNRRPITGGYELSLCQETPFVRFWIRVENRTESYNFTVQHDTQRTEIMQNIDNDDHTSSQKWYLRVILDMNKSRARDQQTSDSHNYLSLNIDFEVWDNLTKQLQKPFLDINLVNDTRFHLNQVCSYSSEDPQNLQLREQSRIRSPLKSLHDNNLLPNDNSNLDDLHINVKRTSPITSSRIGQKCSGKDAFACGNDATCHVSGDSGICECLEGFMLANNGSCLAVVNPTVQPTPSQLNSTTAYSSALGALFSVIVLIAVAAAIFFGTKYRVWSRVRNRFSLHMPFRRGTSIDDQVGMVDPFANTEDDDDPPLL